MSEFYKNQRVFPITQGVACQYKWTWNTVRLMEGTSACCHRVKPVTLTPDNFKEFHNHPTWLEHRELQLQGIFPDQGCQYCGDIEKMGGVSDRMVQLAVKDVYPMELDSDPLATRVTPRILEVFLDNACNLACMYCDESSSSRIVKENLKFGRSIPGVPDELDCIGTANITRSIHQKELTEQFFSYLEENYNSLRRLQILGGEPFYQKQFYRLIEFVKSNNNPNLELNVVSNLMISKKILESFIFDMKELVKQRKIRRFDLTASLDGDDKSMEYLRYGLDINQWKENFELLASYRWIYLTVNSVVTSLNIPHMPALFDYITFVSEKYNRPINHEVDMVVGHQVMHPKIFPPGFFDKYFEELLPKMPLRHEREIKNQEFMKSVQDFINNTEENIEHQYYLKLFLEEFDKRRNTSWKDSFPHLVKKLASLTKPV